MTYYTPGEMLEYTRVDGKVVRGAFIYKSEHAVWAYWDGRGIKSWVSPSRVRRVLTNPYDLEPIE